MSKYLHDSGINNVTVNHTELYSIFNLMKGIHGNAHYFFNGFSEVKGTNEVVINIIKADEKGSEYHVVMYNDHGKETMFTEKYEFINFNNIKNSDIKNEIGAAIRLYSDDSYKKMFKEIGAAMYSDINFKPKYNLKGINCDGFDYDIQGAELDRLLDRVVGELPDENDADRGVDNKKTLYISIKRGDTKIHTENTQTKRNTYPKIFLPATK